jgi:two-component system, OmpR family, copper resistance phosphate regulon response regulator CusR
LETPTIRGSVYLECGVRSTGVSGESEASSAFRLLVVEDEPSVARALREGLAAEGYGVTVAQTGEDGFFLASTQPFDLIVLDRMLPGRDGLDILASLRRSGLLTPVLLLTARDAVEDRVAGLDAGADDYVVKPFAFAELLARLRALLRRGRGDQLLHLSISDLLIDVSSRVVSRTGRNVELTAREYELLEYLVRHQGTPVSREMLARDVWGETERYSPLDNVIDVHITHLRKKVDQGHAVRLIHTLRGVGFIVREGEG